MYFTTNYFFSFFLIYIIAITCKKILKDPLSSFNIYYKKIEINFIHYLFNKLYKMGSSSSKNTNNNEWEIAEKRAIKVYNYRITHFNPIKHGSRDVYMAQVQAEYELECIPQFLRSGGGGNKW